MNRCDGLIHRDDVLLQVNLGVQTCISHKLDNPAFPLFGSEAKSGRKVAVIETLARFALKEVANQHSRNIDSVVDSAIDFRHEVTRSIDKVCFDAVCEVVLLQHKVVRLLETLRSSFEIDASDQ